ncbi:aspartate/glutamate racemase family protein [Vibrio nigripulchritudo]|uniref:aspartate/glutamate racemase family protein n=1 Tax=Vibrio nigripulchritudo TaxID=28173 RepID=UPI0003B21D39|nr:aspartate/glutamate racemase family protein [Vibrio nigripulchritudo]CCN68783.1 Hydantoin racemase [Vibrio nigripulchritudo SFn118]
MKILIVNPNTTASMTEKIRLSAQKTASLDTEIIAVSSLEGPVSIEGFFDEAMAIPGMLATIQASDDFDAVIIACFDDTGLDAARCLTNKPVIGIGEAAYHIASVLSNKFSVVTTLARSVPALEYNILRYGMERRCVKVRASQIPVLELENGIVKPMKILGDEIERAISEDKAEAIVLGCAGMTDLAAELSEKFGLPVLDGVSCAVSMCESIVKMGLKTSRLGGYTQQPKHKLSVLNRLISMENQ